MLAATLAACVGAFSASAGPADAALPGLVTDLTWGIPNTDQDRTVTAMQDVHAKWTRLQIQWKAWETSPGTYAPWEVARTDRAIQLCRAAGIHVLLDVVNAPAWASNTNDSDLGNVPRSNADFANFMNMVAARYRGQVEAYELWNEPDIQRFWNTGPNAAAYTALLKSGYAAVKTADPTALVVSGGLSWDYTGFLGRMYDNGARGYFDVLALHPYPTSTLADWQASYRRGRATEVAKGDDKPIWLTEYGFNTSSDLTGWQPPVSPQVQADEVTQSFRLMEQDPYVQVSFYYNFRNDWWSHDDPTSMEANFGLLTTTFAPKLSYYAFKNYAAGVGGETLPPPPPPPPPPPSAPSPPPPPPAATDAPPQVTLTGPKDGSSFTSAIPYAATASDDGGVKEVRFRFDGVVVMKDGNAPYTATWAVPSHVTYGAHHLTAVAVDSAGQTTTSADLTVYKVRKSRTGSAVKFSASVAKRLAAAASDLIAVRTPR